MFTPKQYRDLSILLMVEIILFAIRNKCFQGGFNELNSFQLVYQKTKFYGAIRDFLDSPQKTVEQIFRYSCTIRTKSVHIYYIIVLGLNIARQFISVPYLFHESLPANLMLYFQYLTCYLNMFLRYRYKLPSQSCASCCIK